MHNRFSTTGRIVLNKSEEELIKFLDEANKWNTNIKLDYKIGKSLPFLDVLLTNDNGILSTSVYHKPATEPYVIPFVSDHPRNVFTNIIKTSLTRAMRYSLTFQAFNYERHYTKLTLLHNGYPSTFIENEYHKFFLEYISTSPFLPFIDDEKQFFLMRHKLLGQPTQRQSQAALRSSTADIDNEQTDDQLIDTKTTINNKANSNADKLFVHYNHEKRFHTLKRDMHQFYEDIFENTPAMDAKLVVGNRNRPDAKNELIHKRPKRTVLQNKMTQQQQKEKIKRTNLSLPTDTSK